MEVSIKFSEQETKILIQALAIGNIHEEDDFKSHQMLVLKTKLETINKITEHK